MSFLKPVVYDMGGDVESAAEARARKRRDEEKSAAEQAAVDESFAKKMLGEQVDPQDAWKYSPEELAEAHGVRTAARVETSAKRTAGRAGGGGGDDEVDALDEIRQLMSKMDASFGDFSEDDSAEAAAASSTTAAHSYKDVVVAGLSEASAKGPEFEAHQAAYQKELDAHFVEFEAARSAAVARVQAKGSALATTSVGAGRDEAGGKENEWITVEVRGKKKRGDMPRAAELAKRTAASSRGGGAGRPSRFDALDSLLSKSSGASAAANTLDVGGAHPVHPGALRLVLDTLRARGKAEMHFEFADNERIFKLKMKPVEGQAHIVAVATRTDLENAQTHTIALVDTKTGKVHTKHKEWMTAMNAEHNECAGDDGAGAGCEKEHALEIAGKVVNLLTTAASKL